MLWALDFEVETKLSICGINTTTNLLYTRSLVVPLTTIDNRAMFRIGTTMMHLYILCFYMYVGLIPVIKQLHLIETDDTSIL
jgi:hypothetical protein